MNEPSSPARADVEATIMALAAGQHGVVTRAQLLRAGVSPDVIDRRLKAERLISLHRGVYRVGPLVAPYVKEMAAVLACGSTAVVSHESAAALSRLLAGRDVAAAVVVSVRRGGNHRGRTGIIVHRVGTLRPSELTRLEGIPITTVRVRYWIWRKWWDTETWSARWRRPSRGV